MPSELAAGGHLTANQTLVSPNGRFTLIMQTDGNLVLYDGSMSVANAYWATNTWAIEKQFRPTHMDMQVDGNVVLYNDAGAPAWSSGVWGPQYAGSRLVLQDDGNLVVYLPNNQTIWSTNTVRVGAPPAAPELRRTESTEVGWGKHMDTTAILYRDGTLTVESYQRCDNWFGGLRGRILVVCIDGNGRQIWISDVFNCPTRCSVLDPSCPSYGMTNFVNKFPDVVGEYTQRLDILQADDPNYVDLRQAIITAIKAAVDIAGPIKAVLALLA